MLAIMSENPLSLDSTRVRTSRVNLLIAHVTRTHDTLTYTYDVGNRLTKWRIPAKTDTLFTTAVTAPLDSVTSVYDSLGNLLRQVNRHGAIKRSYFENGAVRFQVDSGTTAGMVTDSVKYGYDSGGRLNNLVQLNWTGGDTVRYTYKSSGDLDSLNIAWRDRTGVHHETTRFAWDSLGRRRQLLYPFNSMTVTSHYDALGTLRSLESTNPGSFVTQNRFNVTMAQDSVDLLGRPLHQTYDSRFAASNSNDHFDVRMTI